MKTKSIASSPVSRAAGNYAYVHIACNSVVSTGGVDLPPATVYCRTHEECIQGTNGRSRPNAVIHRKKNLVIQPGSSSFIHSASVPGFGVTTYANGPALNAETNASAMVAPDSWDVHASVDFQPPYRWNFNMSALNEQKLIEDCYEKARGLKADVLLNVVEAHQIYPSFKSLILTIPALHENWKKVRKLVRTVSGSYLAYKFGVSPFLQDMADLWHFIPKIQDDLKKHISKQRSHHSAVFRCVASFDDEDAILGTNNGYSYRTLLYQGRVEKPRTIRYVLVVEPRVSFYSDIANYADRLMSRFSTGPASLAWEKVPWSFVADWFVDLRGWLRYLDDAIQAPPYKVVSFTRSDSYVCSTDVFDKRFSPCGGGIIYDQPAGSCRYQHYQRSVVAPGFSMPSLNHRFGKSQAAILAALIAQKLSGTKRSG